MIVRRIWLRMKSSSNEELMTLLNSKRRRDQSGCSLRRRPARRVLCVGVAAWA